MADLIKTKATYAKLAEELLTAQTMLTKQEILVKGLFKSIVKKKIEIIEDRLCGEHFEIGGKKYTLIHLCTNVMDGRLYVRAMLGLLPEEIEVEFRDLTNKEKVLFGEYKKAIEECWRFYDDEELAEETIDKAIEMYHLKHGIDLITSYSNNFGLDEFLEPEFFNESGIKVPNSLSYHGRNLEDYACGR